MVTENSTKVEPEINQSIDEQIIPATISYSDIRQSLKGKKWGFKNFVWAGENGIMYVFFLYSDSSSKIKSTGSNVVMKLPGTLPRDENLKLLFDNWFCTLDLLLQLKEIKISTTATTYMDHIKGCFLVAEKNLNIHGKGCSC